MNRWKKYLAYFFIGGSLGATLSVVMDFSSGSKWKEYLGIGIIAALLTAGILLLFKTRKK